MASTELKDFFVKFFSNLNCVIEDEGNSIVVKNVPANFEKFAGKNSPYYLSFGISKEGYDFVNENYFLIKTIGEFLEGRGETTLLRLVLDFDPKNEIPKKIPLINCAIKHFTKRMENKFIYRFSFSTIFQFQNERKHVTNSIYVYDGKVINLDLENYVFEEGNKRDFSVSDIEKNYLLARNSLREKLKPELDNLTEELNSKLEKEIKRIEKHYNQTLDEYTQEITEIKNQIKLLESKKLLDNLSAHELTEIDSKLFRFYEQLKHIEENPERLKISSEKDFFIQDEIKKHSLNLSSKLINTTIIYYPVFDFDLFFKDRDFGRIAKVSYNPLIKELSKFYCDCCEKELNEIILCSSGHLICRNCGSRCESCKEIVCPLCKSSICVICNKKICKNCAVSCFKCGKIVCKNHTQLMRDSGKLFCPNCFVQCGKCREYVDKSFSKREGNTFICLKCFNSSEGKKVVEDIFKEK